MRLAVTNCLRYNDHEKTGSHNLGYFPVNNNMLPREKKYPEECQRAREETLAIILNTLEKWCV